jgi:tRNA-binding protein
MSKFSRHNEIATISRKPAYKLTIDFDILGTKRSSAQITHHYHKEELIGRQVIAVVNFPAKQIGPFISEVLTLGLPDEQDHVVLVQPTHQVPNVDVCFKGRKIYSTVTDFAKLRGLSIGLSSSFAIA